MKPLVIIESPYRGRTRLHRRYLRACLRDSLDRGEAPFASHGLYTQVLDDDDPDERRLGMEAGWAWLERADLVAVYTDLGVSAGMRAGTLRAVGAGVRIRHRVVPGWRAPLWGWL